MKKIMFVAFAALLLAVPASAVVVQYTAIYKSGLGDGGDPGNPGPGGPNGLPICNQGLAIAMNASVPGAGVANVTAGGDITFPGPYFYGTPNTTANIPTQALLGAAGANGFAQYSAGGALSLLPPASPPASACDVRFTPAFLPPILNKRTQRSYFTMPRASTLNGGPIAVHLGPGRGPAPLQYTFQSTPEFQTAMMAIGTMTNNNFNFGGSFGGSGGGRVDLGVNAFPPAIIYQGAWLTGPRAIAGQNFQITPTGSITNTGLFVNTGSAGSTAIPVQLRARVFPYTVGSVRAHDTGGSYNTTRSSFGFDNRNSAGTSGTLQLVAPWEAQLVPFLNLYFGGTAKLTFNFLPEPGATAMLGAGVLAILGLTLRNRRR